MGRGKEMEFSSKGAKGTVLIRVLFIVIKIRDRRNNSYISPPLLSTYSEFCLFLQ